MMSADFDHCYALSRGVKSLTKNNVLECRVCQDVFGLVGDKVPRLLYCGHTVCHACLLRLPLRDDTIQCPFDRQPTPVDEKQLEVKVPQPTINDLKNSPDEDMIASEVGRSVDDKCKRRRENIKDSQGRKVCKCSKTGSEVPSSIQRNCSNFDESVSIGDDMDIHTIPSDVEVDDPPAEKLSFSDKMRLAIRKQTQKRVEMMEEMFKNDEKPDEISLFYKSITKTVQKFPPQLQQRAKIETLTLISKIESDMWSAPSGKRPLPAKPHLNNLPQPTPSLKTSEQSQFNTSSDNSAGEEETFELANEDYFGYLI